MANHEIKIKLKVDDDFEDIYSDAWKDISIPAYRDPDTDRYSIGNGSPKPQKSQWRWKLTMVLGLLLLVSYSVHIV